MSARPRAAAAGAPAAPAAPPSRLHAVLAAGQRKSKNDDCSQTAVFVVPSNPGVVVPLPLVQPPIDPNKLKFQDAELQYPGFLSERRKFPRAIWEVLPTDMPDRPDAYGNMMSFERVEGTEALRRMVLPHARGSLGGTLEFLGAPGIEYATAWTNSRDDSYINFSGADPSNQKIQSASLSMTTLRAIGDAFPPALEDTAAFHLERSMIDTAAEFEQLVAYFFSHSDGTANYKFAHEYALPLGTNVNIDTTRCEFNYDAGRMLRQTQVSFDAEFEASQERLKDAPSVAPARADASFLTPSNLPGLKPVSIVYRPTSQPAGFFFAPEPAAVVQLYDGTVLTYIRNSDGGLTLDDKLSLGAQVSNAPRTFEHTTQSKMKARINKERNDNPSLLLWIMPGTIAAIVALIGFVVGSVQFDTKSKEGVQAAERKLGQAELRLWEQEVKLRQERLLNEPEGSDSLIASMKQAKEHIAWQSKIVDLRRGVHAVGIVASGLSAAFVLGFSAFFASGFVLSMRVSYTPYL